MPLVATRGHGWFNDRRGERRLRRCWFDATAARFQRPGEKIRIMFFWDVHPKDSKTTKKLIRLIGI